MELKLAAGEIHGSLEHHDTRGWPCPERGRVCILYGRQAERQWSRKAGGSSLFAPEPMDQSAQSSGRVDRFRGSGNALDQVAQLTAVSGTDGKAVEAVQRHSVAQG